MVYSRAETVSVLENYFASKSFAALRETFSTAYPDKEVPNKTTMHRVGTKFRDTGSVCLWQVLLIERQNSWNYGRTDIKQWISCNNGIRLQEFNIAIGFVVVSVKVLCSGWGCVLHGTSYRSQIRIECLSVWVWVSECLNLVQAERRKFAEHFVLSHTPSQWDCLKALPLMTVALVYYMKQKLCLFQVLVVVELSCCYHRFMTMY
jgi:hypothetical protein